MNILSQPPGHDLINFIPSWDFLMTDEILLLKFVLLTKVEEFWKFIITF